MANLLDEYARIAGEDVVDHLRQLAAPLSGMRVVHVNSTRVGGGVAEILAKLVPLKRELGMDVSWEVIEGDPRFFTTTKSFHNALQGDVATVSEESLREYEKTNAANAEALHDKLSSADMVFIHDPQPAPLLRYTADRQGKWIWRCHIDVSRPHRPVWDYLERFVSSYDASVFSMAAFAQRLPHTQYLIPPSIDPLSDKNIPLDESKVAAAVRMAGIDPERPLIVQVSRYDRFKDPVGVIQAYRLAKRFSPGLQLVLAGGGASDDPEAEAVIGETRAAARDDPDIHILMLPPDAHITINALQRAADIVLQKSIKEGFGLTVSEAMWKGKPVIGGDTGGIRLQIIDSHTGFLVSTPEGAALRIRYLLHHADEMADMGRKARNFVRENFLLTRHLRDYLTVMVSLARRYEDRIELG
ncbi:MAG: glycosyltransferase [Candidatus Eisenbacteria bacterium]|nr:glycosyltransferase [Candidatus Eisenbacteria bacterium]